MYVALPVKFYKQQPLFLKYNHLSNLHLQVEFRNVTSEYADFCFFKIAHVVHELCIGVHAILTCACIMLD